jgi:hypothetical protein
MRNVKFVFEADCIGSPWLEFLRAPLQSRNVFRNLAPGARWVVVLDGAVLGWSGFCIVLAMPFVTVRRRDK